MRALYAEHPSRVDEDASNMNMHRIIHQQTIAITAAMWPSVAFVAAKCSTAGMVVTLDRGGARL